MGFGELDQLAVKVRRNAGPPSDREIVLLVGGLAASTYLQESIKLRFGERVAVIVPEHPAAAVMFGAVRYCHRPGIIWSRRSKKTYGYTSFLPFEEGADDEQRREENDEGEFRCRRFSREVQIGESVEVGMVTTATLYPMWRDQEEIGVRLLATEAPNPRYPDDPGVEEKGFINIDISESLGQRIADREVTLRIRFGETEIRAECSNPRTGRNYDATVDFDYD